MWIRFDETTYEFLRTSPLHLMSSDWEIIGETPDKEELILLLLRLGIDRLFRSWHNSCGLFLSLVKMVIVSNFWFGIVS